MSAKADAEAAAALRELGATLKASKNAPKLHTLKVLHGLGLDEEEDELELSMMEELATLVKNADGPAGDKVKYEHAVSSMVKRWKLFLALNDVGEQAPTLEMVKLFVTPGGAGTHTGTWMHTTGEGSTHMQPCADQKAGETRAPAFQPSLSSRARG